MKRGCILKFTYEYLKENWEVDPNDLSPNAIVLHFRKRILNRLGPFDPELNDLIKIDVEKEFQNDTVLFKISTTSKKISSHFLYEIPEGAEYVILYPVMAERIL